MGEFSAQLRQRVLDWLANHVPQSRIEHVLRVEQMAIELARLHQLDEAQAAQAGLMHDLAKYFKPQVLLEMAQRADLPIDPVDQLNPHLLHANVSALVARSEFGLQDSQILEAIADHTLGSPGMAALSCVVFLADSLEPGRGDSVELEHLRQISQSDLTKAVWLTSDRTLRHLLDQGRLIHPRALATRNWFLHHSHTRVVRQANRKPDAETDLQTGFGPGFDRLAGRLTPEPSAARRELGRRPIDFEVSLVEDVDDHAVTDQTENQTDVYPTHRLTKGASFPE